MRRANKAVISAIAVFALFQLVRPAIPTKPATSELNAPPNVKLILKRSCYSCHSDEYRLAWFDQVNPGYLIVRHDILNARSHLNFSTLGSSSPGEQKAKLFECVNMIQLRAMPLPQFVALHPGAKLSSQDLTELKTYLAPWSAAPDVANGAADNGANSDNQHRPRALTPVSVVEPEPNGFGLDPGFEDWKLLSSTDRGDNNTLRFILGNDVAAKAIEAGRFTPWPDGAELAKVAWTQEEGKAGLIYPGRFLQVELMRKDARRFKSSDGWAWGRWRGLGLKPYGDAKFAGECTGCHQPIRGNDYVYTQPITQARADRLEIVNNAAASLPSGLP